jgi:hypothetical protein
MESIVYTSLIKVFLDYTPTLQKDAWSVIHLKERTSYENMKNKLHPDPRSTSTIDDPLSQSDNVHIRQITNYIVELVETIFSRPGIAKGYQAGRRTHLPEYTPI